MQPAAHHSKGPAKTTAAPVQGMGRKTASLASQATGCTLNSTCGTWGTSHSSLPTAVPINQQCYPSAGLLKHTRTQGLGVLQVMGAYPGHAPSAARTCCTPTRSWSNSYVYAQRHPEAAEANTVHLLLHGMACCAAQCHHSDCQTLHLAVECLLGYTPHHLCMCSALHSLHAQGSRPSSPYAVLLWCCFWAGGVILPVTHPAIAAY